MSLADEFYAALQSAAASTPRSQQAERFEIGVSDLGTCPERTRRMLAEIPEPPTDTLAALIGTAVGDAAEKAWQLIEPDAIAQAEVQTSLKGDGGTYVVTGHPDLIRPRWGVIDVKTVDGLETTRRTGPNRQQLFQRHLYALAAWECGLFDPLLPLAEVKTANIWIDRSGRTKEVHVDEDVFSQDIVDEAAMWLDDVVYAHLHGEQAMKGQPREWCAKACGHFATCRALDTDVDDLLLDPAVVEAAKLYRDGLELEKQGARMKDEAKAALAGVKGNTPEFSIRWTHVNASQVNFVRQAYERLSVTPLTG